MMRELRAREGKLVILDTTFRDGDQHKGTEVTSDEDFEKAIRAIDSLGVNYLEVGFASSGSLSMKHIQLATQFSLRAKVAAFGRTHPDDVTAILKSGAPAGVLVGKSRCRDAKMALKKTTDENLRMIESSIQSLQNSGQEVIFDAEHFFQAYLEDDFQYALTVLRTALNAGASWIVLCDTNGCTSTSEITKTIQEVKKVIAVEKLGIHTHNDRQRAIANAEAAYQEGIRHIQGTIGGVGERVGNMDLLTFIANTYLNFSDPTFNTVQLQRFSEVYLLVCDALNITPDRRQSYVGEAATYTEAGMHQSGEERDPGSYLPVDLTIFGNFHGRVGVTEQSGRANISAKARELGLEISESEINQIAQAHQQLVDSGANFGTAEASFYLFLLRELKLLPDFFQFEGFRVFVEKQPGLGVQSEASLRMLVNDEKQLYNADGDGPVNALDNVLRRTLHRFYPELATVKLVNFRVKIVDAARGTAAKVRTLIDFSDGTKTWTTMAVHENLIEASWEALLDGYVYKLMKNGSKPMARA